MRYLIADIHGCYDEFCALLEKIQFSEEDQLWVLGDAVDRGPEPIKVVKKIMETPNIHFIIGNHDHFMYSLFSKLLGKYQVLESDEDLTLEELHLIMRWTKQGGGTTINQFLACSTKEQKEILSFMSRAPLYHVLENGEKTFVLVHACIEGYEEGRPLESYTSGDVLHGRTDYSNPLFEDPNKILVTGHTPVFMIWPDERSQIYESKGHLAIDCGCVFGGSLAAYCVETGETVYVKKKS